MGRGGGPRTPGESGPGPEGEGRRRGAPPPRPGAEGRSTPSTSTGRGHRTRGEARAPSTRTPAPEPPAEPHHAPQRARRDRGRWARPALDQAPSPRPLSHRVRPGARGDTEHQDRGSPVPPLLRSLWARVPEPVTPLLLPRTTKAPPPKQGGHPSEAMGRLFRLSATPPSD